MTNYKAYIIINGCFLKYSRKLCAVD